MPRSTPGRRAIEAPAWSPFTARSLTIIGLSWLGVAVVSAASTVAAQLRSTSSSSTPIAALGEAGIACLGFALLTPGALTMGLRWPIERVSVGRVAIHVAGTLLYWLVDGAFIVGVGRILPRSASLPPSFGAVLVSSLFGCIVAYAASVGIAQSISAVLRLRQEQARHAELAAELSQARLNALTGQLRPHFLFNALNAVSALIGRDAAAADRLVVQLGNLLRLSLARCDEAELPLEDEIAFLRLYLDVMSARIGPRLTVAWSIDERVRRTPVPQLILLPLVENALKHGIGPRDGPGRLEISATSEDGILRMTVADDGLGLPSAGPPEGIGMRTTRRRLAQLYGDAGSCALTNRWPRGALVTLLLPFRSTGGTAPVADARLHAVEA